MYKISLKYLKNIEICISSLKEKLLLKKKLCLKNVSSSFV